MCQQGECDSTFVNQDDGTCACPSGYTLYDNYCYDCTQATNCNLCSDTNYCTNCTSNFIALNGVCVCSPLYTPSSANSSLCVLCNITGCTQCDTANICSSCNSMYTFTAKTCIPCSILDCDTCNSPNSCSICQGNLSISANQRACYSCNIENCMACSDN